MSIESINPATGEVIETFEPFTAQQIDETLARARKTYLHWRTTSFTERSALMRRVAATLRARKAELARVATLEMGKPIAEAEAEVEKCAWNCDYLRRATPSSSSPPSASPPTPPRATSRSTPLGVVLAIMPWNFPFWQVFRFAAPALMAGNAAVLKHASNVPGCALAIEEIFREAGLPDGALPHASGPGAERRALIADPRIARRHADRQRRRGHARWPRRPDAR